jgi:hypothetical protein
LVANLAQSTDFLHGKSVVGYFRGSQHVCKLASQPRPIMTPQRRSWSSMFGNTASYVGRRFAFSDPDFSCGTGTPVCALSRLPRVDLDPTKRATPLFAASGATRGGTARKLAISLCVRLLSAVSQTHELSLSAAEEVTQGPEERGGPGGKGKNRSCGSEWPARVRWRRQA